MEADDTPNPLDHLGVRLHYYGLFDRSNGQLDHYTREKEVELYIPRDKLCYAEVWSYVEDMYRVERGHCRGNFTYKLYWLAPGKSFSDGLLFLHDDSSVQRMDSGILNVSFADIYVEEREVDQWYDKFDVQILDAILDVHFDREVEQTKDCTESTGLVSIHVGETYSMHRGTRLPLISVQVVQTKQVDELILSHMATAGEEDVLRNEPLFSADTNAIANEGSSRPEKLQVRRRSSMDNMSVLNEVEIVTSEALFVTETKSLVATETPPPSATRTPFVVIEIIGTQVDAAEARERVNRERRAPMENADEEGEHESDLDYEPSSECSSIEESEAKQVRKVAREIRRQKRDKKLGKGVGHVVKDENVIEGASGDENLDGGNDVDEFESDDDCSYDEESDGEEGTNLLRKQIQWKRFDSKAEIPSFHLGMVIRGRAQMKKALINYGIKTHRHIGFTKDETNKVRAHCTWPGCKWMIYASKTTRNKWMEVSTFVDEHNYIPRWDNKMITSSVIAKRYGRLIKSNPSWKLEEIKKIVFIEMFADVTIAQCKRAKRLVLSKLLDSSKGEYSKVFDYELELLRSNPGSSVAVKLHQHEKDGTHVFQSFYICFDACKKGFLAGCRQVIGTDGCFFKGACYG